MTQAQKEFSSFAKRPLRITCAITCVIVVLLFIAFFLTELELFALLAAVVFFLLLIFFFISIIVGKIHRKCPLCGGRIRLEHGPWINGLSHEFAICDSCGMKAPTGGVLDKLD